MDQIILEQEPNTFRCRDWSPKFGFRPHSPGADPERHRPEESLLLLTKLRVQSVLFFRRSLEQVVIQFLWINRYEPCGEDAQVPTASGNKWNYYRAYQNTFRL